MNPLSVHLCRRPYSPAAQQLHSTVWCNRAITGLLVPDAKALNSRSALPYVRSCPSNILKTTKWSLECQSYKTDAYNFFFFCMKYTYTKFPLSRKSRSRKLYIVKATVEVALFRWPKMNESHYCCVAVKEVIVLYLVTLLQYKVSSDYAITSNFSISKEAK